MNTRKGIVHGVEADRAWILARREGACGDCTHGHCCTVVDGHNRIMVKAINTVGAEPGDVVTFWLRESIKLKWMAILFALPVIAALLGALAGNFSANALGLHPESIMAGSTPAGFVAGLFLVRFLARSRKAATELTPIIVNRERSGR